MSYLGKKYIIKRTLEAGRVASIKLDGINDSREKNRGISAEVRKAFSGKKCVILDVKASKMEIDHKNARYNSSANERLDTQKVDDFQPLSKAANDAKRQHCKNCKECGKRYDARRLGYSTPYIFGNEKSKTCPGCYWYDPHYFNEVVSKGFKKLDE